MNIKKLLLKSTGLLLLAFAAYAGRASGLNGKVTLGCSIPDTVKYEAERGILIGTNAHAVYRSHASNDSNVTELNAVKFIMLYSANAIKLCYGTGNTGTTTLKVNSTTIGTFSLSSTGDYNNIGEAQISVNVNAGDTVYVGSPGVYFEMDCIKAYKAPNKLPYVSITLPAANDTVDIEDHTTVTASANDTDGTIVAVKFAIAGDTTYIDSFSTYTFSYLPKSLGHKSIVATAYDNCGDSTVTTVRNIYVLEDSISWITYEAEHGTPIGTGSNPVYRPGVSNDTNVQNIAYTDHGMQFIMTGNADGIILGYGTFQTGTYRLKVNGVNKGLFTIIKTNNYTTIFQSALYVPVSAGDTVFVGSPGAGGAYLEMDYIRAFTYDNRSPMITLTNPHNGDTLYLDSSYTFTATATDADGTVDSVKFHVDGYEPYVDAASPYTYNFTADSTGFKTIKAIAYDNRGDSTTSYIYQFLVRNTIPDSLVYQAEHGILVGIGPRDTARLHASNDSTVTGIIAGTGVKFVLKYPADAIFLGYGGNQGPKLYHMKINGVDSGYFDIQNTGDYGSQTRAKAQVNVRAAAGDTVFICPKSGDAYLEVDFIVAYNANGFVSKHPPIDTLYIPENEDWDYVGGKVPSGWTIRKDTLDGDKFDIKNDTSVITKYSFDYEVDSSYYFTVDTGAGEAQLMVKVTNVTGTFDQNGFATSAIAAKYPGVNVGDYIYWNTVLHVADTSIFDTSKYSLSYPNKILIHANRYRRITLDLTNAHGNSTAQPVVVTNFLGQVELSYGLTLRNLSAVRVTGKYDSAAGYGHRYYKGWEAGYEFPQGTFGIFCNNRWKSQTDYNLVSLDTTTDKVELDNIEAGNGGFSGINWKDNGSVYAITDSSRVHHCFIHDVGSEGLYLGSTQPAPQQVFTNFTVDNNVFLRCGGEGIQTGWLIGKNTIKNNIVHSAVDWKNPFEQFQDGIIQVSAIGGGTEISNNIFMGGGEGAGLVEIKNNTTPYSVSPDTILFKNNLFFGIRGGLYVQYGLSDTVWTYTDSNTHLVWDGNYYKQIGEDYYELNPAKADTSKSAIWSLTDNRNVNIARNNCYDYTVDTLIRQGFVAPTLSNNTQKNIEYPHFRNYLDRPDSFNYLNISRYTDTTIFGDDATWEMGNIVQWWNNKGETRFYECIQATASPSNRPPQTDGSTAYWQLLTWTKPGGATSYFPPDDVRLDSASFFDSLGMGFMHNNMPSSMVIKNKRRGDNSFKANGATRQAQLEKQAEEKPVVEFSLYPNPAAHSVRVESNTPMQTVEIYDAVGRQCSSTTVNGSAASIDIQTLNAGVYFVRISAADGNTAVKQLQVLR